MKIKRESYTERIVQADVAWNVDILLATAPLRLTVTPFCNFNCRTPGTQQGWCMEEPGEYTYPKIRASLLKKDQP